MAWPGQRFVVKLIGVDQFSHLTTANARLTFSSESQVCCDCLDWTSPGENNYLRPTIICVDYNFSDLEKKKFGRF